MRAFAAIVCSSAVVSSASAGFLSSAMIDDFSGSGPGLGFSRQDQNGGSVAGGFASMSGASGFHYLMDSPGYVASGFSGFSLKVDGSLGTGGLYLNVIGADFNFIAFGVDFGSTISNGYAWITFSQIDAAVGNDPGALQGALGEGTGFVGIGLYTTGNAAITVDDFEFRTSAVPAPGALALLGVAGLAGGRRRR